MKITQTDNQMEIKTHGTAALLVGILVFIIGAGIAVAVLAGVIKNSSNGQSVSIFAPIVGIVMAVVGVISAFLASNHDTILQKGGTSTVSLKHILFGNAKIVSFDTKRIVAVSLDTSYYHSGTSNNQRRSQLSLMLDDNSLVQVASSNSGGGLMINGMNVSSLVTKAPLGKQADQISQFLGVPLQASGAVPSISTVVHDVVEAAHENAAQNSAIIEPPLVVNQPPIASVIEPPIQPSAAPVTPVEPISPPENTNWQS